MSRKARTEKARTETFWQKLGAAKKPFFVLAPMANVTDSVFRKIIAKYGKPDVMWTEFVSADGLCSGGRDKLLVDLVYSRGERPIVAQLFTGHPEAMRGAAKLAAELGFDGLDINMGCPDRAVEKQGGGAACIKDPKNAVAVIEAAREGWALGRKSAGGANLVSVKTRLGYNKVDMDWIRTLLDLHLPALTVHLRTRKEMSDVPAHWELMPEIVKLRDEVSPQTLIIGNGDVMSLDDARQRIEESGCDGVMIGRGIFGKPWFFSELGGGKSVKKIDAFEGVVSETSPEFRLKVLLEHTKLFEKTFKGIKSFNVMKKHFKAYVSGWDGAKELRVQLMEAENSREVGKIIKNYLIHLRE